MEIPFKFVRSSTGWIDQLVGAINNWLLILFDYKSQKQTGLLSLYCIFL